MPQAIFLKLVLSNARRGPSPLKNSRGAFRILGGGGVQNDAGGLFQARGLVRFYRFTPPLDGPASRVETSRGLGCLPAPKYMYVYVCIYRCFTSKFVYIGGGKQSQEMRDL